MIRSASSSAPPTATGARPNFGGSLTPGPNRSPHQHSLLLDPATSAAATYAAYDGESRPSYTPQQHDSPPFQQLAIPASQSSQQSRLSDPNMYGLPMSSPVSMPPQSSRTKDRNWSGSDSAEPSDPASRPATGRRRGSEIKEKDKQGSTIKGVLGSFWSGQSYLTLDLKDAQSICLQI